MLIPPEYPARLYGCWDLVPSCVIFMDQQWGAKDVNTLKSGKTWFLRHKFAPCTTALAGVEVLRHTMVATVYLQCYRYPDATEKEIDVMKAWQHKLNIWWREI